MSEFKLLRDWLSTAVKDCNDVEAFCVARHVAQLLFDVVSSVGGRFAVGVKDTLDILLLDAMTCVDHNDESFKSLFFESYRRVVLNFVHH